jgi:hypothetical protein
VKFLGRGNAADHLAPFQDERLPSRFREVEGGDEAIVAAADDDDVLVSDD